MLADGFCNGFGLALQPAGRSARGSGGLTVIKPVPEAVEAILYKVFGRSKIEPRVNCLVSARVPECHVEYRLGF